MHKTIRATDLEDNVRSVLRKVAESHISWVVTEEDEPEVVLIPYDEYLKLQRRQREEVWERIESLRARMAEHNAGRSDEEIAADIDEARREIAG